MLDRLRHHLLGRWARLVCDHPVWVLSIAGALAVAAIALAAVELEFQSDRNALLSEDLDWNRRYIEYLNNFAGNDDFVLVVKVPQGEDGPQRARRYVDDLVQRLREQEATVEAVYHGYDPDEASPALVRTEPLPELRSRLAQMAEVEPALRAENITGLLNRAVASLRQQEEQAEGEAEPTVEQGVEQIRRIGDLVAAIEQTAEGAPAERAFQRFADGAEQDFEYITSDDGELLLVQIAPRLTGGVDANLAAVRAVRQTLGEMKEAYPGIEAGLTGVPVIEADETDVVMRDSTICSVVAVVLIGALLVIAFHGWRKPMIALAALLTGVAWTFGFLTLAVGHLQLLSIVFTVILLGLGIDYGIHLASRFELVRHRYAPGTPGMRRAVIDTFHVTGPGILTGAVTTAIAFGTTLLTDFKGMAEMGLIAGVGILLCLVAMFSVFPALLWLTQGWAKDRPPEQRPLSLHGQRWLMPMVRHPWPTVLIGLGIVAAASLAVPRIRYEYNLVELLPRNVSSVQWQETYMEHSEQSVWFGASTVSNMAEARERAEQFRALDSVQSLGGVGLLVPINEREKNELIRQTRQQLGEVLDQPPPPVEPTEPEELRSQLNGLATLLTLAEQREEVRAEPRIREALSDLRERAAAAAEAIRSADSQEARARLAALNEAFGQWRQATYQQIDAALTTRPLRPDDLPPIARREAVGRGGQLLLKVYPAGDVYEPETLDRFVSQMKSVDPQITGTVVQIHESRNLIQRSYIVAGFLAFVAVFLLAFFDFGSVLAALFCLLPVTAAFVTMFGVMWLVGVAINPANIIVLPLLFGLGVDAGVHMVHRYRAHPYDRPPGLTAGTGKGILLTSLTTLVGFGVLMFASHRGIASLGFVLAVGISLTLIACLTLMPAVLELRNRYSKFDRIARPRRSGASGPARNDPDTPRS